MLRIRSDLLLGLVAFILFVPTISAQQLKFKRKTEQYRVVGMRFSPDSKTLAVAGYDSAVSLWNTKTGKQKGKTFGLPVSKGTRRSLSDLSFRTDGKLVASLIVRPPGARMRRPEIWLWDVVSGKVKKILHAHSPDVLQTLLSPDGKLLASQGGDSILSAAVTKPGEIKLWDVTTGNLLAFFRGRRTDLLMLGFSRDGKTIAALDGYHVTKKIRVWEVATGKPRGELDVGFRVWNVCFSPGGRTIAVASSPTGYHSTNDQLPWDLVSGKAIQLRDRVTRKILGHIAGPTCGAHIAFRPDSKMLASANDSFIKSHRGTRIQHITLWDVKTRKPKATLKMPCESIWALRFSPDGTLLAAAVKRTEAKTNVLITEIYVWDVSAGMAQRSPTSNRGTRRERDNARQSSCRCRIQFDRCPFSDVRNVDGFAPCFADQMRRVVDVRSTFHPSPSTTSPSFALRTRAHRDEQSDPPSAQSQS